MSGTAPLTWAQRQDSLYLTIALPDVDKETAKVDLTETSLKFSGKSGNKTFTADIDFFAAVDPSNAVRKRPPRTLAWAWTLAVGTCSSWLARCCGLPAPTSPRFLPPPQKSKWEIKPRSIQFHIIKKESGAHWPSLTKDKAKEKGQVSIDWTRYVDEDEEKGGFDLSGMGGGMGFGGGEDDMGGMMGGMGGMGGRGGMGGMSGMGGMGGPGGLDMAALMKQFGGGAGGAGGADFGAGGDFGAGDDEGDEEDGGAGDDMPPLQEEGKAEEKA